MKIDLFAEWVGILFGFLSGLTLREFFSARSQGALQRCGETGEGNHYGRRCCATFMTVACNRSAQSPPGQYELNS